MFCFQRLDCNHSVVTDIMNLLSNHDEFRTVTHAFAARLQQLLGIDVQCVNNEAMRSGILPVKPDAGECFTSSGQLPSPSDMAACAHDEELRGLSIK